MINIDWLIPLDVLDANIRHCKMVCDTSRLDDKGNCCRLDVYHGIGHDVPLLYMCNLQRSQCTVACWGPLRAKG